MGENRIVKEHKCGNESSASKSENPLLKFDGNQLLGILTGMKSLEMAFDNLVTVYAEYKNAKGANAKTIDVKVDVDENENKSSDDEDEKRDEKEEMKKRD